ncbi:MAG: DUF47 family protein [Candidatus Hodarchaeales archaeon]|jgi:predicted phosphate transport protein (TIGR00153 family)
MGEELVDQFSKEIQIASSKLSQAITLWTKHITETDVLDRLYTLEKDVIDAERKCDSIKEKFIDLIFKKGTVLPAMTSEYYQLIVLLDSVVNEIENSIRKLTARKDFPQRIPHELPEIANRQSNCTKYLFEALHNLKEDRKQVSTAIDKIDEEREAARELDFHIFGRLVSADYTPKDAFFCHAISASITSIIEATKAASSFIRALSAQTGARPSDII